jgi:lysophospholipase L1-like esterase
VVVSRRFQLGTRTSTVALLLVTLVLWFLWNATDGQPPILSRSIHLAVTAARCLDAHLGGLAAELGFLNPDRANLAHYAASNRVLPPPAAGEQRVVFLGDSITEAWQLNEYFQGKPYLNRGISGQTTGGMLDRMKTDVIDLKPKAMVVLAGTNDLAFLISVDVIKNHLAMIGNLARANGIKVIYASILPVSDYAKNGLAQTPRRPPRKILEINNWLKEQCEATDVTYLDFFSALADDRGLLRADLSNDGLHVNAAGYKVMAPLAEAAIEKTLTDWKKASD